MRVLVIANPIAGRGRALADAAHLGRELEGLGCEVQLLHTAKDGDNSAIGTAARNVDRAVVVGGDGTLGTLLPVLPRELPVGQLPRGTANVLALDLGLPRDPAAVARMVQAGRTTGLDVAQVGERLSFLVVGVGPDGAVLRDVDRRRKGRPITKLIYVRSAITQFARQRHVPLEVELDGKRLDQPVGWLLISNMIHYGGVTRLAVDRRLDDGLWEVLTFPSATRRAMVGYGMRGLAGRLPGGSVKMSLARHVRVHAAEPVPYQIDGDFGGMTPIELHVNDRQRLIVP
jgi:diacylglycerol kinase (ATP)